MSSIGMLISYENSKEGEEFLQFFHRENLGHDECVKAYDDKKIVKAYHGLKDVMKYEAPGILANMLAGLIPDLTNAKILDLAAGSGIIGKALYDRGFRNIDAHDGAAAMVDFCRTTGHYNGFHTCFVGNGDKLTMEDDTYDSIACSGATLRNHLPASAQSEIARVIKPGGFFVNAYRANLYETEVEYANEWREEAERLEKEGKWILYGVLKYPRFIKETAGRIDIYQIL
ncbi:hypothetical protein RRG08_001325 [Elysia crispata]|uniref:Methyltransferase type 11 domain-containing protein n=1 Tax=Elysia crispata TaxID=231223 RepID=A0AAE0ZRM8_9GAST|nr:hypothetical protein RRG08_001325 [Elysia crispata]